MTRTNWAKKPYILFPQLYFATYLVCMFSNGCGLAQGPPSKQQDKSFTSFENRPFSFDFGNVTIDMVFAKRIKVLNRGMGLRSVWAKKQIGRGGISYTRNDCTSKALLETHAKFEWWIIENPRDRKKAGRRRPDDPNKVFQSSTLFPNFDVEAESWRCLFTLHDDKKWVGKFEGAKLKPMGAKPESWKKSRLEGDNQWIQFQFRNLTKRDIYLLRGEGNLVHAESEIELQIPNIPSDEKFYGVTAQCHPGSIYRPLKGDHIVLSWGIPANQLRPDDPIIQHTQKIDLPEFDLKIEDWFCYFTLNPNNKWSANFESVVAK